MIYARSFCDEGYNIVVALDAASLDLARARAAFDACLKVFADRVGTDTLFTIESALLAHECVQLWAFDADKLPLAARTQGLHEGVQALTDASWDEWEPISTPSDHLRAIEDLAGFRWGSIRLIIDSIWTLVRISHKHAEGGLGVFDIDLSEIPHNA